MNCKCLFIAVALLTASLASAADDREQEFLDGLRERRLYRLATIHCQHLLAARPPADQAWIVAELVRSFGIWAADSPPEEAPPRWAAAHEQTERFLENHADHPQRVLVLLQNAVVSMLEGRVAAETETGTANDPAGRAVFRRAIRQLEQTRDLVEQQLREVQLARPDDRDAFAFSAGELERFRRQTVYELSRAFRLLATTYPPESADRVSALLASIEHLKEVISTPPTPTISWVARVDRALSARLLGRRSEAASLLEEVLVPDAPASVYLRAQAEQLRLAMQVDGFAPPPWPARSRDGVSSPEFDLALLEAMLAQWRRTSGSQAADLSDRISRHVEMIGAEHGGLSLRRAKRAVGKQFATPGAVATDDGLRLAAESLFLAGNYDEAVAAYDRAAKIAAGQGKLETALELARSAAAVQLRRGSIADARCRLLTIADSEGPAARRADAHHAAIVCTAMLARETAESPRRDQHLAQYRELLEAHVTTWPAATTTPTAWLWLGQLRHASGSWEDAIEAYRNIDADHPAFTVAVRNVTDSFDAWLSHAAPETSAREAIARQARKYYEPWWDDQTGAPPSVTWEAVAGWTRLALRHDLPLDRRLQARVGEAAARGGTSDAKRARGLLFDLAVTKGDAAEAAKQFHTDPRLPLDLVSDAIVRGTSRWIAAEPTPRRTEMLSVLLNAGSQLVDQSAVADVPRDLAIAHARLLDATGEITAAREAFARLVARFPDDRNVHERRAVALLASPERDDWQQAIAACRTIESRSESGSESWRRARRLRIEALEKLGQQARADQLRRLSRALDAGF